MKCPGIIKEAIKADYLVGKLSKMSPSFLREKLPGLIKKHKMNFSRFAKGRYQHEEIGRIYRNALKVTKGKSIKYLTETRKRGFPFYKTQKATSIQDINKGINAIESLSPI